MKKDTNKELEFVVGILLVVVNVTIMPTLFFGLGWLMGYILQFSIGGSLQTLLVNFGLHTNILPPLMGLFMMFKYLCAIKFASEE